MHVEVAEAQQLKNNIMQYDVLATNINKLAPRSETSTYVPSSNTTNQ